jgi:hypothetical protein
MSKKLIALIVSGLLVIALIIYFIFIYDFNKAETPGGNNQTNQEAPAVVKDVTPITIPARDESAQLRDQAAQLAVNFAERYGSSSSQSDFSNLSDLELFMTPELQVSTKQFVVAEQQKPVTSSDYAGVTTKAIVPTFTAFDATAGTATVTVSTKRQEENASGEIKTYNQNLKLTMKKIDNQWKVHTAAWE